ncbi:hypothetical protein BE17_30040 [Sorangium cellulosum]|uniref:Uncharacterized protein n=1 Tax=Sorangium cellulosum TaxID=56 RepID=A0A150SAY0_SORCE|nr:hypothetical protein BE17_30040 [Sorangium cellulosum]
MFGCLMPVGLCLGLGWRGVQALAAAVDPRDPVHTLRRMSPADDGHPDRVYLSGTIASSAADPFALCLAVRGGPGGRVRFIENYRRTADAGAWLVADGRAVRILGPVTFEPAHLQSTPNATRLREMLRDMPEGGQVRAQCVSDGDLVFAEGCREALPGGAEAVKGCGDEPVILTPGDGTPAPRIDQRRLQLAGPIFGLCAACLLLLAYGWRLVGASPLLKAMARYAGYRSSGHFWALGEPTSMAAPSLGIGIYSLFGGAFSGTMSLQFSLACFAVLVTAAVFIASARERRRVLRAADALLSSPSRAPLTQATGGVVSLDVNVKGDHPVEAGLLTGEPRAFSRVEVRDVPRVEVGAVPRPERRANARLEWSRATPSTVAFEHASGEGALELGGAEIDLRALRGVLDPDGDAPRPGVFRHLASLDPSSRYEIEESYMEPGEPLFVVGTVKKAVPSAQGAGYRTHAVTPVIGDGEDAPLLVVAGTGASLRRELLLEARYLKVATAVAVVAGLVAAAQMCWLVQR